MIETPYQKHQREIESIIDKETDDFIIELEIDEKYSLKENVNILLKECV